MITHQHFVSHNYLSLSILYESCVLLHIGSILCTACEQRDSLITSNLLATKFSFLRYFHSYMSIMRNEKKKTQNGQRGLVPVDLPLAKRTQGRTQENIIYYIHEPTLTYTFIV
jgi:hypothetical protein